MERLCRFCSKPFGFHATDCPVKYRDETNPRPEVQYEHEKLDEYYEMTDDAKAEAAK